MLNKIYSLIILSYIFICFQQCNNHVEKSSINKNSEKFLFERAVLNENRINQPIHIIIDSGETKTYIIDCTYLGKVLSNGKLVSLIYKYILSGNYSPQLNNYLVLYDADKNRIGQYYIGDFEATIQKNNRIKLLYVDSETHLVNYVDLTSGIPDFFYVTFDDGHRDIMTLSH